MISHNMSQMAGWIIIIISFSSMVIISSINIFLSICIQWLTGWHIKPPGASKKDHGSQFADQRQ